MTNLEQQIVSLLGLKLFFNCQREIEGESLCEEQCDHCKEYYKPIEKTPNISFLQVVRAKYEVEKRRFAKDIVFKAEHGSLTKISFSRTWKDFITDLWIDWQGESLSEQTDELKSFIEGELE